MQRLFPNMLTLAALSLSTLLLLQSSVVQSQQVVCGDVTCKNTEFCGSDTLCHAATCEDFFVYGPANLTGYRPDKPPVELDCMPVDATTESKDLHAVLRACAAVQPGTPLNTSIAVGMSFNRRCTAVPSYGVTFDCYSLQDTASTYFDAFEEQASLLNETTAGCDILSYLYQTSTVALIYGEGVLDTQGLASRKFSPNLASATFYSILSYDVIPTASPFPTMSPTTLQPSLAPVVPTIPSADDGVEDDTPSDTSSATTTTTTTTATTRMASLLLFLAPLLLV